MEARRQHLDLECHPGTISQCPETEQWQATAPVSSYRDADAKMEDPPPIEASCDHDAQQPHIMHPPGPLLADSSQNEVGRGEATGPDVSTSLHPPTSSHTPSEIDFSTQWNNRRDAIWDIIAPKRGTQPFLSDPAPLARAAPKIWAENIYDAQDVLPYFTVGQTILASKIPRAVSRCVLLTRNLHDIRADWKSGEIEFLVKVRYKLQLNRPKKWKAPSSPGKLINPNCKPMDPIQFRKLRACCEGGIPVRVLATGDFPSLPILQPRTQKDGGLAYSISSNNWQNGLVMLGFFWVKKVSEVEYTPEKEDLDTGKCSGSSRWAFKLLYCDIKKHPSPWWRPLGDDLDGDGIQCNDITPDDDGSEFGNALKRRRVDLNTESELCGDVPMLDAAEQSNESKPIITNRPRVDSSCIDPELRNLSPLLDGSCAQISACPDHPLGTKDPPEIYPEELGLELGPSARTHEYLSRAPKLRASILLGWLCLTCGRLNSRKKWTAYQSCPLCQATSTALILPEWHRRAHTEAAGPIGTFFRLDDGGHQPKTGLHQMAIRNEETGLTFVEYWLAEAPMPILAELNRAVLVDRRKARRTIAPTKMLETPQPNATSSSETLAPSPSPSTPVSTHLIPVLVGATTHSMPLVATAKGGTHPDGGNLARQRDPGGSRAIFSENTRMLFMHITRPQHPAGLPLVDQIFSGFATDVQMERQENNATYRTGPSTLSCHYTYLAGCGTHIMHTSSPAVDWDDVPSCIYDAHASLVDYQRHTVFDHDKTVREFNQNIFIMGNGATGTSTFRITHRAEDGPVGYMVFGASCSIEILVGNGEISKRTTKGGAMRRAELLLAHGDALMTMPVKGDAPLEIRVKRTGLSVVSIGRHVTSELSRAERVFVEPQQKERLPVVKHLPTPVKRSVTPAKRKAHALSAKT